jgi:hypothetical protein
MQVRSAVELWLLSFREITLNIATKISQGKAGCLWNEEAIQALTGITILGSAVTGILLLLDLLSVVQHLKSVSIKDAQFRWRLSLLIMASTLSFCVFLLDRNLVGDSYGCEQITTPHVLFYLFAKQSMDLFLYDGAKIVHESLAIVGNRLKYLQWFRMLLWLTLVLGKLPLTIRS